MNSKILMNSKAVLVLLTIVAFSFSCKKSVVPSPSVPLPGTGSFVFNGTTYTGSCSLFDSSSIIPGRLNEITIETSAFGIGYSPIFIIDYMPIANTGTFPFTSGSATPYQAGTVYGACAIIKGSAASQHDYHITGGTLTKTGVRSFSFTCTAYDEAATSSTYTITGSGTY